MEYYEKVKRMFSPPPAEVLAVRQLEDAKRMLLEAHAYREEAEAMVQKYQERIARLTATVRTMTE